jgi:hypothetical protein
MSISKLTAELKAIPLSSTIDESIFNQIIHECRIITKIRYHSYNAVLTPELIPIIRVRYRTQLLHRRVQRFFIAGQPIIDQILYSFELPIRTAFKSKIELFLAEYIAKIESDVRQSIIKSGQDEKFQDKIRFRRLERYHKIQSEQQETLYTEIKRAFDIGITRDAIVTIIDTVCCQITHDE